MQWKSSCWRAGHFEAFKTSSLMLKSLFFRVKWKICLPARWRCICCEHAMCNQAAIDPISSAPCCFPNWDNLVGLESSPLRLHCTAFASHPVSPRRALVTASSQTPFKDCPTKTSLKSKTLHWRKFASWESVWEWLHSDSTVVTWLKKGSHLKVVPVIVSCVWQHHKATENNKNVELEVFSNYKSVLANVALNEVCLTFSSNVNKVDESLGGI